MQKQSSMPAEVAAALSVRERVMQRYRWLLARITEETGFALLERGLVQRDTTGRLSLTDHGRAVLRAMLPEL